MSMIGHIVNRDQLLSLGSNNSGNVFLKFVIVLGSDQVLSAFDGEHDLNVDLSVGVSHVVFPSSLN